MSLPTSVVLPIGSNYSDNDMRRYNRDLVFSVQGFYEEIVQNVNGFIHNNAQVSETRWIPTLAGIGAGDFTYTSQYGWSVRKGIYNEVFFDITWSASAATGNLYLNLPYKVAISDGMPFVGVLQPSNISFAGGTNLVINAIQNTYRGEIWTIGSSIATANLSVPASGRLIGSIKYIGQSVE